MFKTLKWVYGLGVKQERMRISAILQQEAHGAVISYEATLQMLDEATTKRMSKERRNRLEFATAVNDRIGEIITGIFYSGDNWVPGESKMYPDDGYLKKDK